VAKAHFLQAISITALMFAAAASAATTPASATGSATPTFVTTQLTFGAELTKLKGEILKGVPVTVVPEQPVDFAVRLPADLAARPGVVNLFGALATDLVSQSSLEPLDAEFQSLNSARTFFKDAVKQGQSGGKQMVVPWMHTSFFMVANKKALPYLPTGATLDNLTYRQLLEWGENLKAKTGQARLGLPAGKGGLIHRFVEGYVYPSYTGGMVRTFRSPAANSMWADMRRLWAVCNPNSANFDAMSDPLLQGQVWVAFDHAARLFAALSQRSDEFVVFPAPSGTHGRGFFYVLSGLAVPANSPDKRASVALINHLTSPAVQAVTFKETGFFPIVSNVKTEDLNTSQRLLLVSTMAALGQSFSSRALVSPLPQLAGAYAGKFNDIYRAAFKSIAIDGEAPALVLDRLAPELNRVLAEANAPCWGIESNSRTRKKGVEMACSAE
jgi:multiple sugar transport system substrate-binding protein